MNPTLWYFIGNCPLWVWLSGAGIALTFVALFLVIAYDIFGPKPLKRVMIGDTIIEVWERERKMPGSADAIVVPVAPDLKMSSGIAKWVRTASADAIQHDANRVAPLEPGDAFVGSGGKYRFGQTALAVVMDNQKRTSPEWIRQSLAKSLKRLREEDAHTVLIPDMTEDLLQQPKTITDEQRAATARPVARAIVDGILESDTDYDNIRIWAWKGNRQIWEDELNRLAEDVRTGQARAVTA